MLKHRLAVQGDTLETIALKQTLPNYQYQTVRNAQAGMDATIVEKQSDGQVLLEYPGHSGRPATRWLVDELGQKTFVQDVSIE